MGKIRDCFDERCLNVGLGTGVLKDSPELPATILVDDIREVIIEGFQPLRAGDYYWYATYPYPISHHME